MTKPAGLVRLQKDDRLVGLMRGGHERAFEVLFERYHSRLLAFCQHMLASREDAEDVLQEVFVAAHKAILADSRAINVRPWLYRIARNRCLNHLRKPVPEGQDTMDVHPHENGASTAERVQNREEFRQLVADVQTLPETQRTALLLREVDAMTYEEIAQAMDTTVPSIKSLLVRARITLAESSQSRLLTCGEVQLELAEAAEGLRKVSGPVRQHVRGCEACKDFRSQLRSDRRALAALFPIGPLFAIKQLIGAKLAALTGGSAAGGGAAGGAAAGGAAAGQAAGAAAIGGAAATGAGGIGGAVAGGSGAKTAAGVAAAALLTAGAVEVKSKYGTGQPIQQPTSSPAAVAYPVASEPEPARHKKGKARKARAPEPEPVPEETVPAEPVAPVAPVEEVPVAPPAPVPADPPAEESKSDAGSSSKEGDEEVEPEEETGGTIEVVPTEPNAAPPPPPPDDDEKLITPEK